MIGQGMTGPILPLYARSFGVSTAVIGLTITFFALARLILNIPAGRLADSKGRRLLLISGPVVLAIGMVGSGLAFSIWDLLAWRFVAGAGSALYMSAAQLYILDISPPERRGRNLSYNSAALLAGVALGPAMGGIIAEVTNFRVPFLLVGVFALSAAAYSYFRLEESLAARPPGDTTDADQADSDNAARTNASTFTHVPSFVALCAISFAMFSIRAGGRGVLVPLLAIDEFGLSEGELGVILGATSLVGLAMIGFAGQAADRIGRKRTIVPTGVIAAVATLALVVSPTVGWLTASLFLLAFGTAVTGPAQYAFVADITSDHGRGRALGLYRSAGDIGFLSAPPILGWLADQTSIGVALATNAAVVAVATLLMVVLSREPATANS